MSFGGALRHGTSGVCRVEYLNGFVLLESLEGDVEEGVMVAEGSTPPDTAAPTESVTILNL